MPEGGGDSVDELLEQIEKAAKIDAENNYRILDNHLLHSDRVISGMAAMAPLSRQQLELAKAILENPT